jgi:hypothetical protein
LTAHSIAEINPALSNAAGIKYEKTYDLSYELIGPAWIFLWPMDSEWRVYVLRIIGLLVSLGGLFTFVFCLFVVNIYIFYINIDGNIYILSYKWILW